MGLGLASSSPWRKVVLIVTAIALVAMAVVGCGGGGTSSGGSSSGGGETSSETPQEGGTLELSQGEEFTTTNPLKTFTPENQTIVYQIFEPLFAKTVPGKSCLGSPKNTNPTRTPPSGLSNCDTGSSSRTGSL